jgi:hypothetical protein
MIRFRYYKKNCNVSKTKIAQKKYKIMFPVEKFQNQRRLFYQKSKEDDQSIKSDKLYHL